MLIVDPTQGRNSLDAPNDTAGLPRRLAGRVCLLSNAKPNASELLLGLARDVPGLHGAPLFAKQSASLPAPDALLDRIADDFDTALVAIAD